MTSNIIFYLVMLLRRHIFRFLPCKPPRLLLTGFSLVELMVAMAVISLIIVLVGAVVTNVERTWKQTASRTNQFREARRAFEAVNRRLSQATLNAYWDYIDKDGKLRPAEDSVNLTFVPVKYARQSELRYFQGAASGFVAPHSGTLSGHAIFFQAPVGKTDTSSLSGMTSLVNTVGYYIEACSDADLRPPTIAATTASVRFRLFEMVEPSESLTIYSKTSENAGYNGKEWITVPLAIKSNSHLLATNIVAFMLQAEYTDAAGVLKTSFTYDSSPAVGTLNQPIEANNLPPSVRVTMIAIDDAAGRMIQDRGLVLPSAVDATSLAQLEQVLVAERLSYRKFQTSVKIGAAKWSAP
ncbi:MAG: Verru_Chthon cassette protein C [Candidatus Methylacidiphilales bacterium]